MGTFWGRDNLNSSQIFLSLPLLGHYFSLWLIMFIKLLNRDGRFHSLYRIPLSHASVSGSEFDMAFHVVLWLCPEAAVGGGGGGVCGGQGSQQVLGVGVAALS